jgi:hypothetical protein
MIRSHERGNTIVEAAIALPLLLLFIIGILDFGRAYDIYQIETNAAREAARYAVAPYTNSDVLPRASDIQNVALSFLNSGNICPRPGCPSSYVAVDSTPTETINGVPVTYTKVTVTVPYVFIAAQYMGLNTSVNITSSATMRNETN